MLGVSRRELDLQNASVVLDYHATVGADEPQPIRLFLRVDGVEVGMVARVTGLRSLLRRLLLDAVFLERPVDGPTIVAKFGRELDCGFAGRVPADYLRS